jgi:hypothetical protein
MVRRSLPGDRRVARDVAAQRDAQAKSSERRAAEFEKRDPSAKRQPDPDYEVAVADDELRLPPTNHNATDIRGVPLDVVVSAEAARPPQPAPQPDAKPETNINNENPAPPPPPKPPKKKNPAPPKKQRQVAGHDPERARAIYFEHIDTGVVEEDGAIVSKWLSGDPADTKWEETQFELLDDFGPRHVAEIAGILACYDGDDLHDIMVLLLDDDTSKLLDIADAVAQHATSLTIHQLAVERHDLLRRVAELEKTIKNE